MSLRSCYRRNRALKSLTSVFQTAPRDPLVFLYPRWLFSDVTAQAEPLTDAVTGVRSLHCHIPSELQKDLHQTPFGEEKTASGRLIATLPRVRKDSNPATPPNTTAPPVPQQHVSLKLDTHSLNIRRVAAIRKSHDKRYANKVLHLQLKGKNRRSVDWRVALDILETHSYWLPTKDGHCKLHITVPREDVGRVIGRFGNTLRDLQEQSGCLIQVIHEQKADVCFTVQITGTAQGTHKAEKLVMAIVNREHRALTGYAPMSPASMKQELDVESSTARQTFTPPIFNRVHVDGSPQITYRKAARRFFKCMKQLSESPVTHRRNRFFRSQNEPNLKSVAETISRLFSSVQSRPVITTQSVNEAMKFFVTHNLVAHARRLFADSELHYLNMDTSTFNIMLRRAAEARDLHNFTFVLRLMVKRNARPDGRTWSAFLSVVDQKEVKSLILEKMKERKLLADPVVVREVSRQIISDLAIDWLNAHRDPRDLLEYMDGRFTTAWYSASAINRVLDELGKRGMVQEAWDLLEAVDARGFTFNSISMNTILTHCLHYRRGDWAVQLFHAIDDRWRISPDGVTYELLFKTSWTSRLYNMARVVWRYACMDGAVSFRMRQLVKRSLRYQETPCSTVGGRWRATAGKVIAGVSISRASDTPNPSSGRHTSRTVPIRSTEVQEQITAPELSRAEIVEQDLAAFRLWQPVRPLSTILSEAFAIDTAWSTDKRSKDHSVAWKLRNAIDVPVKPKAAEC